MNLESKKPSTSPKAIEISKIKAIKGAPLNYRFNASGQGGNLNFEGMENANLTKKGEAFTLCPIGYRAIKNRKFGREKSIIWVEIFFLNEKAQFSSVFFNNSSGENMLRIAKILEYEDLNLAQIKLTIAPRTKSNKDAGSDYYVCDFSYEELNDEDRAVNQTIVKTIGEVYRRDTVDAFDAFIDSFNYPVEIQNACLKFDPTKELPNEQIKQLEALEAEFDEVGMAVSAKRITRAA